mmetsp:Transcript_22510/g.38281  ORF Transcript_22510/g.38281 Transcript_22510/m.38281 type:complete len:192 (-) Transcript_22510:52-627(-)
MTAFPAAPTRERLPPGNSHPSSLLDPFRKYPVIRHQNRSPSFRTRIGLHLTLHTELPVPFVDVSRRMYGELSNSEWLHLRLFFVIYLVVVASVWLSQEREIFSDDDNSNTDVQLDDDYYHDDYTNGAHDDLYQSVDDDNDADDYFDSNDDANGSNDDAGQGYYGSDDDNDNGNNGRFLRGLSLDLSPTYYN